MPQHPEGEEEEQETEEESDSGHVSIDIETTLDESDGESEDYLGTDEGYEAVRESMNAIALFFILLLF